MEDNYEIEIIEGHDSGSYFWIMPVKRSSVTAKRLHKLEIKELRKYEISIEEDDVFTYLYPFLKKYFYRTLKENIMRANSMVDNPTAEVCFEWNLEYNFYTFDAIRELLQDIKETIDSLMADDGNKKEVINFYEKFIKCLIAMLKLDEGKYLISFMGP